jgi:hypothetical protein
MKTRARMTAVRAAPRLMPQWWLAFAVLAFGVAIAAVRPSAAQEAPATVEIASADELATLVGPIALYPDDLVAIVLPASTYPLQVVQAARFMEDRKRDSNLEPDEDWDDSVVALLNYPEVVELLNGDLDWTYDLGAAVLNQRADVLNAIQAFRDQAYAAGNLRSDERQTVARDDGAIAIKPADPQVIYVPYYEPDRVVVYQPTPVYYYYPRRYPVYYYPYPAHYTFDTGFFWGVRSWYSIGWHSHHVHVYDWHYQSHPYFGWSYYDPWYPRNVYVNINVNRSNYVWEPRQRYGGRPVVRGYEGRVYTADTPPPARAGGGMAGGAYRSRSVESTQASQAAATRQPRRGVLADTNRSNANRGTATAAPQTESNAYRGAPQRGSSATPARTYRSGGGMSQALERQGSQVAEMYRSAPAQRARQATGMPREAARNAPGTASPPRAATPTSRESSGGGMSQAQRSTEGGGGSSRGNSGGGYRGGESGGGSRSDGGGRSHPAARGSAGR